MQVVERDGRWVVEGPGSERARVEFANLADGDSEYEFRTKDSVTGSFRLFKRAGKRNR